MQNKLIAVAGPTASGKTALAVELAKRLDGEVVSCDSMQIYKHMNIGTAKPTEEEKCGIVHHMIDIIEPWESYSVAAYAEAARRCIDDITERGKLPILAGGTGLYMDSVLNNTAFTEFETDMEYRRQLQSMAETDGEIAVHNMLKEKDPEAAEKIHPNNVKRVIRALEVCRATGKTFTQVNLESVREPAYDALVFGPNWDREVLYERINRRVDIMIESGLEDEVRQLTKMGLSPEHTAMQAIGYKELVQYFDGQLTFDEAVDKIKQESRRYAKRQMTWFKRNPDINWIMLQNGYSLDKTLEKCFTIIDKFDIIE